MLRARSSILLLDDAFMTPLKLWLLIIVIVAMACGKPPTASSNDRIGNICFEELVPYDYDKKNIKKIQTFWSDLHLIYAPRYPLWRLPKQAPGVGFLIKPLLHIPLAKSELTIDQPDIPPFIKKTTDNGSIAIEAFYDDTTMEIVIPENSPLDRNIGIHELCHYAQDIHFHLAKMRMQAVTSDEKIALRALAESECLAIEFDDFFASYCNKHPEEAECPNLIGRIWSSRHPYAEKMRTAFIRKHDQRSSPTKSPPPDQLLMHFPYSGDALRFYEVILATYGFEGLSKTFLNPPVSTEQILHPEKYFAGERGLVVSLDPLFERTTDTEILEDTAVGELALQLWLNDPKAAAGWDGDRLIVVDAHGQIGAIFFTHFDTDNDAAEFANAVRARMALRAHTIPCSINVNALCWLTPNKRLQWLEHQKGERSVFFSDVPLRQAYFILTALTDSAQPRSTNIHPRFRWEWREL